MTKKIIFIILITVAIIFPVFVNVLTHSSTWSSFMATYYGALLGAVITLVGVYIQLSKTKEGEEESKKEEIKNAFNYFKIELEFIKEEFEKYINFSYLENIKKSKNFPPPIINHFINNEIFSFMFSKIISEEVCKDIFQIYGEYGKFLKIVSIVGEINKSYSKNVLDKMELNRYNNLYSEGNNLYNQYVTIYNSMSEKAKAQENRLVANKINEDNKENFEKLDKQKLLNSEYLGRINELKVSTSEYILIDVKLMAELQMLLNKEKIQNLITKIDEVNNKLR